MGVLRGLKKVAKPFVNFPAWMGLGMLRTQTRSLTGTLKSLFTPKQPHYQETYEEGIARMGLTDIDLKARMKELKRMAGIMALISFAILSYATYLIWSAHFLGAMVGMAVSTIPLAQGFKFHFWYFQLKKRKFGCTFKEWLHEGLLGKKQ